MLDFKLSGSSFAPHANKLYEHTNIINVSDKSRLVSAAAGAALYVISFGKKKTKTGSILRYSGLYLLYRGISGNCPVSSMLNKNEIEKHTKAINIRTSIFINAPKEIVYNVWRDLEKLPKFLKHIKSVEVMDAIHSKWILATPGTMPNIEWKAEIIEQENASELSWRSLPGSMVETVGKLNFVTEGNATRLIILISYKPPAGYIGRFVGTLFNTTIKNYIKDDILRFKKQAESIAKKAGQGNFLNAV